MASCEARTPVRERDIYVHGPAFDLQLTRRTVLREAAFFLPHRRAGTRVLDCRCGPGSITIGLAAAVAPGQAVGIDPDTRQIATARALAAQEGLPNVAFEVGNVYDLPFANASFDAAFANSMLFHLSEPLAAVRQMRRVLKPGGLAGIRDPDVGAEVLAPPTPDSPAGRTCGCACWRTTAECRAVDAVVDDCLARGAVGMEGQAIVDASALLLEAES
jgi:SAM-dependent methyltransferase